jgi:hypothetical protein
MKLLTVNVARSIWLFNTGDLNPRGLDLRPVLEGVRARYRFEKFISPDDLLSTEKHPEFGNGAFTFGDGQQIAIPKLTLYNDGLVVEVRHSTEAGDAFLNDLVSFVISEFRLTADPIENVKKLYLSELEVTGSAALDAFNEKIQKFSGLIAEASKRDFHTFGFKIGTDPALHGVPVMFAFERKAGAPFAQNRYWSQAPFSTKHHLELLDRLEKILVE